MQEVVERVGGAQLGDDGESRIEQAADELEHVRVTQRLEYVHLLAERVVLTVEVLEVGRKEVLLLYQKNLKKKKIFECDKQ